ncbi:MAG: alpha/beta fold hydrolase [Gammaproteobacteria bacterium]|nr:alpha/beta fold hydrolase [Gammaproteobacteria bacterium]
MKFTVERLFDDPPLTGTLPIELKFSPDGRVISYLKVATDNRERLDLWRYDIATRKTKCWVNTSELLTGATLSDAEKTARERLRQFTTGISSYAWCPTGERLLLVINGAGYLLDVKSGELDCFTPPNTRHTDLRFSPRGRFITYVRERNLYCFDVAKGRERALTSDDEETISNGLADFIAQEEMHRFEGYWWRDDEKYLAYTRVDESPVAVSNRFEINADKIDVVPQRYPFAGADNATIQLGIRDMSSGDTRWLRYKNQKDDYLARVNWAGDRLAVQIQSRDQTELALKFYDVAAARWRQALSESSDTWINLHDNFTHLGKDRFLWTSERDGFSHLYLQSGNDFTQLTRGNGSVARVLYTNEDKAFVTGWFGSPVEQQLYTVPLDGSAMELITWESGWHDIVMDAHGEQFIDRLTALNNPGQVSLRSVTSSSTHTIDGQSLDSRHPYFPYVSEHSTPTLGTLTAEDGQQLHFRLTAPHTRQKSHPVVVFVYGGPGVQRVRNEWSPMLLQLFQQRGFGVMELDNRGSSGRGRAFESPIHMNLGDVEVTDQLAGVRHLKSLRWVDPNRIGVFGHSYGGFMTLMCLAKAPEVFKAGVAVAPVSDWSLYDTHYTERYLGTLESNAAGYASSSVFPHLKNLKGKLLLMHGMADDNVLFTHSTMLYKALQAANIPFEMMTYPGAKHALQESEVSVHRFNLILDFFERNL